MQYIGCLLLSTFLLNPCFAQEGYGGHYANAFSGIKTGKRFVYQNAGGAFVVLNEDELYSFPTGEEKQKVIVAHPQMEAILNFVKESQVSWDSGNAFPKWGKETGIVFNGNYPESYQALEALKTLKVINMGEVPQYVVGREAGFKIATNIHKAGSLSFYSDRMNNLPMLMLAGPHGGGGGAYDIIMAVGPHGGGGGAYMKAYRWGQEEISTEELKERMQTAGISEQVFLYVVNGFNFKNPAMYEQAGILEKALGVQVGFGSMYEVSREELLSAIMEGQGIDIQKYVNDNNAFASYYQEMVAAGYIDSKQLAGATITTPVSAVWNETEDFVGDSSWVIQEVPFNMIKAILLDSQGGVK